MDKPTIHNRYRSIPASKLLLALADSLTAIKAEDELTDADLGAELGKHEDTAAKYRAGLADMPGTTLLRAFGRWNGRFANPALALLGLKLVTLESGEHSDRGSLSALTHLLLQMSLALETDDEIDDDELTAMGSVLENAGQAIDRLRERRRFRGDAA